MELVSHKYSSLCMLPLSAAGALFKEIFTLRQPESTFWFKTSCVSKKELLTRSIRDPKTTRSGYATPFYAWMNIFNTALIKVLEMHAFRIYLYNHFSFFQNALYYVTVNCALNFYFFSKTCLELKYVMWRQHEHQELCLCISIFLSLSERDTFLTLFFT